MAGTPCRRGLWAQAVQPSASASRCPPTRLPAGFFSPLLVLRRHGHEMPSIRIFSPAVQYPLHTGHPNKDGPTIKNQEAAQQNRKGTAPARQPADKAGTHWTEIRAESRKFTSIKTAPFTPENRPFIPGMTPHDTCRHKTTKQSERQIPYRTPASFRHPSFSIDRLPPKKRSFHAENGCRKLGPSRENRHNENPLAEGWKLICHHHAIVTSA